MLGARSRIMLAVISTLVLAATACGADLVVDNQTISGTVSIPASGNVNTIQLGGTSLILATGSATTVTAVQSISLQPGFVVRGGATLALRVIGPFAAPQAITTLEDTAGPVNLIGSGTGTLTYTITANPTKGTLSGTGTSRTYTPNANVNGTDSFQFTVTDSVGTSLPATVSLTVTSVPDTPTLTTITPLTGGRQDQTFKLSYVQLVASANEFDGDGDPVTFRIESIATGPLGWRLKDSLATPTPVTVGVTILDDTKELVWTPPAATTGTLNAFSVKAYDGSLLSATAVMAQVVVSAPTRPSLTAVTPIAGFTEDTTGVISFVALQAAANEADPENDPLIFRVEAVTNGTMSIRGINNTPPAATVITTPVLFDGGKELVWSPALDNHGQINACTITAYDAISATYSTPPVSVPVLVTAVNDTPSIGSIANASITEGNASGPLPVTVGDVETPLASLVLTATSSNTALVPVSGISFAGSGATRFMNIVPATVGTGASTITVTVSDGTTTRSIAFLLTVAAANTLVDGSDADVTVEWTYRPGGAVDTMTARNRQYAFDGPALVTSQTTTYLYDSPYSKSLATTVIYPDSTGPTDRVVTDYDRLGRITRIIDQRGVIRDLSYDNAGRPKLDAVTTYPSAVTLGFDTNIVPIPTAIATTYDNLGRKRKLTTTGTTTSTGQLLNSITWSYDDWGQVATAAQNHGEVTQTMTYQYEVAVTGTPAEQRYRRLSRVVYPDGSAGMKFLYNDADPISGPLVRVQSIVSPDNSAIDGLPNHVLAEYRYLGAATPVSRKTRVHAFTGTNTYSELTWDVRSGGTFAEWDRFGRTTLRNWLLDGAIADGQTQAFDRVSNPIHRVQSLVPQWQREEAFAYDRMNRLVRAERGTNLAPGMTGRSVTWSQRWTLDSLGNWSGFLQQDSVDPTANLSQSRQHNLANEIDDDQNHATLSTTAIAGGDWVQPVYDAAGCLASGPRASAPTTRQHYSFDAWNRLCVVRADSSGAPGAIVAAYVYDGLNRRVEERAKNADYPSGRTWDVWFSESWQELTRSIRRIDSYAWRPGTAMAGGKPEEFFWDAYEPDVLLGMTVARDNSGVPLPTNLGGDDVSGSVRIVGLRYAYDTSNNVTTVAGLAYNNGTTTTPMRVIERSRYTPYGQRTVYRAANWRQWSQTLGTLQIVSTSIARHGFGLGVSDAVAGLVYLRNRWYDTGLGRFISRDPAGYEDNNNLYAYVSGGPIDQTDASGLGDAPRDLKAEVRAVLEAEKAARETTAKETYRFNPARNSAEMRAGLPITYRKVEVYSPLLQVGGELVQQAGGRDTGLRSPIPVQRMTNEDVAGMALLVVQPGSGLLRGLAARSSWSLGAREIMPALRGEAENAGRIFYVGEGAESLARQIGSETGYKTIYDTWYGKAGKSIENNLSKGDARAMWDIFSRTFAREAKESEDIITVFGRHLETGLHTLPIKSRSAWKRVEYPILEEKKLTYRPVLTK